MNRLCFLFLIAFSLPLSADFDSIHTALEAAVNNILKQQICREINILRIKRYTVTESNVGGMDFTVSCISENRITTRILTIVPPKKREKGQDFNVLAEGDKYTVYCDNHVSSIPVTQTQIEMPAGAYDCSVAITDKNGLTSSLSNIVNLNN